MAAPSFGKVTGRVVRVIADSNDADNDPDIVPVDDSTTVTFTPRLPYGQNPGYGILLPQPITAPMVNGYIMSPGNIAVAGCSLYPTDDPSTSPTNWTYGVVIKSGNTALATFDIAVPSGSTLDIATLIPAASSPGISVATATALIAVATKAATDSAASAAAAAAAGGGGATTNASNLTTGTLALARIGTGTPAAGKYLDGGGAWTALPTGGTATTDASLLTSGTLAMARIGTSGTRTAGYYLDGSGAWVQVTGGSSTTDASLLTSGFLPAARIATGTITDAQLASGTSFLAAERTKLTNIATAATANQTDAYLLARGNGTGTQLASTISDFSTAADARITLAAGSTLATLSAGKIPTSQIPAIALTNVTTYTTTAAMIAANIQEGDVAVVTVAGVVTTYMRNSGVTGTLTDYTVINTPDGAGVTSVNGYSTASVTLSKSDLSLGNVDNTADVNKAVLSATKLATARSIAGVNFDGTANINLNALNIVFTPTGTIAATNVSAAIVEAIADAVAAAVLAVFPNSGSQAMRFTGYGTTLPTTGMQTGDIYFVAG